MKNFEPLPPNIVPREAVLMMAHAMLDLAQEHNARNVSVGISSRGIPAMEAYVPLDAPEAGALVKIIETKAVQEGYMLHGLVATEVPSSEGRLRHLVFVLSGYPVADEAN